MFFRKIFKTSGQGYIDKKIVIFKKIQKVSQGENPLQAFLFFVKFTVFVSVEQGDINKFCVSEKVYLGYTAATKSCYLKKEKMISRAKKL